MSRGRSQAARRHSHPSSSGAHAARAIGELLAGDLRWCVGVEYERALNCPCEQGDRCEDGYHRNSQIVDPVVVCDPAVLGRAIAREGSLSPDQEAGVERIIRHAKLRDEDFRVTTMGGYYGEEVRSVDLVRRRELELAITEFLTLPNSGTEREKWLDANAPAED